MTEEHLPITCIACSIFRSELEELVNNEELNITIRYVDSMMHMHPAKLHRLLDSLIKQEAEQGRSIILLFGDCHPYMREQAALPYVVRVNGINCPEIILGSDEYRKLRKQGDFFLLPEWTLRWKEVFQSHLGLTQEVARDFMRDMHSRLLYLDNGHIPIPEEELNQFARYSGLPWEIRTIGNDQLSARIAEAIKRLAG